MAFESSHWSEYCYVRNVGAEVAGKGMGMLDLDVGGDAGGRSVLWVAEGGNKGPRKLGWGSGEVQIGIRGGSECEVLEDSRVWGIKEFRKERRFEGYRSKGAAVKRSLGGEL